MNDELEHRVAERTEALLRRERELRSLADNTPDILTRFDRDLRYVFVNSAIEKATGRRREEFLGRAMRDAEMPEDFRDLWEQALRSVFEAKKPSSIEFDLRGPRRAAALRHPPGPRVRTPRARSSIVLGVTQDVTDRKRAEEALKNADRRKDEFLATLAHELRNPLAPLRSGLQLLNMSRDPVGRRRDPHDDGPPALAHGPAHRRPARRLPHHER